MNCQEEEVLEYKVEDGLDIHEDADGQWSSTKVWWSILSWSHVWYLGQCPDAYHVAGTFVYQWCGSSRNVHRIDKDTSGLPL